MHNGSPIEFFDDSFSSLEVEGSADYSCGKKYINFAGYNSQNAKFYARNICLMKIASRMYHLLSHKSFILIQPDHTRIFELVTFGIMGTILALLESHRISWCYCIEGLRRGSQLVPHYAEKRQCLATRRCQTELPVFPAANPATNKDLPSKCGSHKVKAILLLSPHASK